MSFTIYDVDSAVIQIFPSVTNHTYSRDQLLDMKTRVNSLPDLEENIIRTQRDIAHMILPNFEPNQIVETVEKSEKETLDWDDEIVEMVSNIKDLDYDEQIELIVNLLKTTQDKINQLQSIIDVLQQSLRKEFPKFLITVLR